MAVAPMELGLGIAWDRETVRRRSVMEFTKEIAK
jgi:hypothetical protein